jgi:protein-S-isoprenylcysteine O-methyltransferase Ste14
MKPYFLTHPVGYLYLAVLLSWYLMEFIQFLRQQAWRQAASKVVRRSFWAGSAACVTATITILALTPHIAPAAAIGHGAIAFAVGMAMLVAGAGLRVWSFLALGEYFTFTVKVSADQPVVTSGPYRLLRHPGYAGGLLAILGIGVLYGNWVILAALAVMWLGITLWRIRIEENALLTTLGGSYRTYASGHKRLVPLVW